MLEGVVVELVLEVDTDLVQDLVQVARLLLVGHLAGAALGLANILQDRVRHGDLARALVGHELRLTLGHAFAPLFFEDELVGLELFDLVVEQLDGFVVLDLLDQELIVLGLDPVVPRKAQQLGVLWRPGQATAHDPGELGAVRLGPRGHQDARDLGEHARRLLLPPQGVEGVREQLEPRRVLLLALEQLAQLHERAPGLAEGEIDPGKLPQSRGVILLVIEQALGDPHVVGQALGLEQRGPRLTERGHGLVHHLLARVQLGQAQPA